MSLRREAPFASSNSKLPSLLRKPKRRHQRGRPERRSSRTPPRLTFRLKESGLSLSGPSLSGPSLNHLRMSTISLWIGTERRMGRPSKAVVENLEAWVSSHTPTICHRCTVLTRASQLPPNPLLAKRTTPLESTILSQVRTRFKARKLLRSRPTLMGQPRHPRHASSLMTTATMKIHPRRSSHHSPSTRNP